MLGGCMPGLRLVQLEAAQILHCRRIRRPADEGRERPDVPNVVTARLLVEAAHGHVLNHPLAERADGTVCRMGGHRGLLYRAEGCWTFDARERMPDRHVLPITHSPAPPKKH